MLKKDNSVINFNDEGDLLIDEREMYSEPLGKSKEKIPGWVIIPILLLLLLLFVIGSRVVEATNQSVAQLKTIKVSKGNIKETYNTSGIVESEKVQVFYSPVNAPIMTCNAIVGEAVEKGSLLIEFDTSNLEHEYRQSELNVLSTRYTNKDTIEQSSRNLQSMAEAELQRITTIENLKVQIDAKQSEINQLEKMAEEAANEISKHTTEVSNIKTKMQENLDLRSELNVVKENAERELTNYLEDDQERNKYLEIANDATKEISKLEIEYRELEKLLESMDSIDTSSTMQVLSVAQQELSSLKSSLSDIENNNSSSAVDTGLTDAQIQNMQIAENMAELNLLNAEELLNRAKEGIKAEFGGVISNVKAMSGSEALQGGELFTLVSNQDVSIKLEVPANDFDKLAIGNEAEIIIGKTTYKGEVASIDKIISINDKGNSILGAKIYIKAPDDEVYVGASAKINIMVAEKKDILCLPNESVNTSKEGNFVYIIKNGIIHKQMVELGISSIADVEILNGLKEGEQVVVDTSGGVKEGMKAIAISSED